MHTIKKQKRITQSQLWRTEIWFASVEIESHWKAWILNYLEFNTGWCMSRVEQTTYEPVLWCRAVPKTGGVLCILAQLCLSFIRSPAHHAQPFQKMQNLLYLCNCLITAVFKIYLNTLMFDVLNSVRKTTVPSAFSYLKLIIGIDSALIYIVSLLLFFNLLFFFFKQSGFNSGHLINQTQTICCSPVSCWSALPEVSDMFQGCSLTLSLPLSAVLLQICSFHPTHSDWALFTVMTIYDSRSARQFVSKYRTCAKASYTTNCYISMKILWTKEIMATQRNIH